MSDLMKWMYNNYIKPYVQRQPKDDEEIMWFSLLDNELYPHQQEPVDAVAAFYAVQGFRLGVKTGLAVGEELRDKV